MPPWRDPVRQRAPLLLAYDAENARGRAWVDWIRRRDRQGLVVSFPFQNPELLRIAPELAGRPLHLEPHGLDARTRRVWIGRQLLAQVWARLPGWRWVIFLIYVPGINKVIKHVINS
jgi:predicted DCC family thiol-disulfide oxidoreductase YuxK